MKVPLEEQIQEAIRHRDILQHLLEEGVQLPDPEDHLRRLHRAEGIVLTLTFNQTYEAEWRAFMEWWKSGAQE